MGESNEVVVPEAMPTVALQKEVDTAGGSLAADVTVSEMWDPHSAAIDQLAPKTQLTKDSSSVNSEEHKDRSLVMHLAEDLIKAHQSAVQLQIDRLQSRVSELLMRLLEQPCVCTSKVMDRYASMGAANGSERQLARMLSQMKDLSACQCTDSDEVERPTAQPTPNSELAATTAPPTSTPDLWLGNQTSSEKLAMKMAMKLEESCEVKIPETFSVMQMADDLSGDDCRDAMDVDVPEDLDSILPLDDLEPSHLVRQLA